MVNDCVSAGIRSDYYEEMGKLPFGRLLYLNYINAKPNDFVYATLGDGYIILLDRSGRLYSLGFSHYDECKVPQGSSFVKVVSGDNHCVALTVEGKVYKWGCNYDLQLSFDDLSCVDICCNSSHSVLLTDKGEVKVYGSNYYCLSVPRNVKDVFYINALENNILAIRDDHTVFAWGEIKLRKKVKGIVSAHFTSDDIVALLDNGEVISLLGVRKYDFQEVVYVASSSQFLCVLNHNGEMFGYSLFGQFSVPQGDGYCFVNLYEDKGIAINNGHFIVWNLND
ncbi:MAG: hypothetical protein SNJ71_02080 [Bacteroidales bacterium]